MDRSEPWRGAAFLDIVLPFPSSEGYVIRLMRHEREA